MPCCSCVFFHSCASQDIILKKKIQKFCRVPSPLPFFGEKNEGGSSEKTAVGVVGVLQVVGGAEGGVE